MVTKTYLPSYATVVTVVTIVKVVTVVTVVTKQLFFINFFFLRPKTFFTKKIHKTFFTIFFLSKKVKMWQNSKTQNVKKFKNLNLKKLKNWQCDKTQKLKMWQNWKCDNSKTQNVPKHKNSKHDKTQKLKMWRKITQKLKMLQN